MSCDGKPEALTSLGTGATTSAPTDRTTTPGVDTERDLRRVEVLARIIGRDESLKLAQGLAQVFGCHVQPHRWVTTALPSEEYCADCGTWRRP